MRCHNRNVGRIDKMEERHMLKENEKQKRLNDEVKTTVRMVKPIGYTRNRSLLTDERKRGSLSVSRAAFY